jgi:hypothetical protein
MKNVKPELKSNQPAGCGVTRPSEHALELHGKDTRIVGLFPAVDAKKAPVG